jgi:ParB-like chromosome segregation protein Spo0J
MSRTPKQKRLLDGVVQGTDEQQLVLLQRLGITALPAHETLVLPITRILVPGEELLARPSQRLVKSIVRVGILQAPAVMLVSGSSLHDEEARFSVVMGRRRILAARSVGLPTVTCEAYETGTPQLSAFLSLIENEQRSAAWVKEVQDLRQLIDDGVGMTLDDLAACGFDRGSLAQRLKIALLPPALLNLIFAGKMNLEVARKIARLNQAQQARVAQLAEDGEEVTAEQVKSVLRAQINSGLAPLQGALAQAWTQADAAAAATPMTENGLAHSCNADTEVMPLQQGSEALTPRSLASTLVALQSFERQLGSDHALQRMRMLTTALIQELQVTLRHTDPILTTEQQKGGTIHV